MSLLSATFRPASGLENATMGQKLDCTKDKMKSGVKFAIAQGVTAGLGTAGMLHALKSDKFTSSIAKVVDKAASKTKLNEVFHNVVEGAKKNPKLAKAVGAIALATTAVSSIIAFADFRKNGKIEDMHQERVNNTNQTKKEA